MMAKTGLLLSVAALTLAGCAHKPIDVTGCDLPLSALSTPPPPPGLEAVGAPPSAYEAAIAAALAPPTTETPQSNRAALLRPVSLFLSGGSQNGAFGAGFIDQWRTGGGGSLPEFRVVSGISTGALIGTTVFTGHSDRAVAGYTIDSEADLVDVKARGLIGRVREGAAGTLDPLRRRLGGTLDDTLLGEIAAADAAGRKFFVGVVDVRDGEAYAVDMTALASRWAAADPAARPRLKQCYIEALIASSSVPLAAPPVYIDGRMLVDGGMRFGVFRAAEASGAALARSLAADQRSPAPASFVIVNGTLAIEKQCPFAANKDGSCPAAGVPKDWDLVDLGLRSVDILTNQVYRFSAGAAAPAGTSFVRIEPDARAHVFNGRSCADWRALDKADKPPPVQFHKREMLCLIDYGRARSRAAKWWERD
ncbi:patatin-like phospholipase family protein [Sandarakinorhabdus sp. DWP1-3-1]|uniref:patatin-like phospholipase family protein n=1 Tax=Sandarakinorhabdus sp. DWP1-3-1 TaxID=2804627 RepID=UPI003CF06AC4